MGTTMNLCLILASALLFLTGCTGTSSYYAESYVYSPGYKYWYPYGYRYGRGYGDGLEYYDKLRFHKHKYSRFHAHRQPNYKPRSRYQGPTLRGFGGKRFWFGTRYSGNESRQTGCDHRLVRQHKLESGLRLHPSRHFSGRHSIGHGHGFNGLR